MTQTYKYREIYLKLKQDILSQNIIVTKNYHPKDNFQLIKMSVLTLSRMLMNNFLLRVIFIQRKDKVTLLKH